MFLGCFEHGLLGSPRNRKIPMCLDNTHTYAYSVAIADPDSFSSSYQIYMGYMITWWRLLGDYIKIKAWKELYLIIKTLAWWRVMSWPSRKNWVRFKVCLYHFLVGWYLPVCFMSRNFIFLFLKWNIIILSFTS